MFTKNFSRLKKLDYFAVLRPSFIKQQKDISQNACIYRCHENIQAPLKAVAGVLPSLNILVKELMTLSAVIHHHLNV